jgi:Spy/CpxP family protein refolding chaperone
MQKVLKFVGVFAFGIAIGALSMNFLPGLLNHAKNANQPYAGQNKRVISSLSQKDIVELEKGAGWGLAKPAEFNGYPGPAHVLEFADKLNITDDQRAAIETSFEIMNARARELGTALIEAEEALDSVFQMQKATPELLTQRLKASEEIRAALRAVHLNAHLEITPFLSDEQKAQYAALRGYGDGHSGHEGH